MAVWNETAKQTLHFVWQGTSVAWTHHIRYKAEVSRKFSADWVWLLMASLFWQWRVGLTLLVVPVPPDLSPAVAWLPTCECWSCVGWGEPSWQNSTHIHHTSGRGRLGSCHAQFWNKTTFCIKIWMHCYFLLRALYSNESELFCLFPIYKRGISDGGWGQNSQLLFI